MKTHSYPCAYYCYYYCYDIIFRDASNYQLDLHFCAELIFTYVLLCKPTFRVFHNVFHDSSPICMNLQFNFPFKKIVVYINFSSTKRNGESDFLRNGNWKRLRKLQSVHLYCNINRPFIQIITDYPAQSFAVCIPACIVHEAESNTSQKGLSCFCWCSKQGTSNSANHQRPMQ